MENVLSTNMNFRSLSLKDLLQARDLYHYHLLNKANVVGTAVGLYLIRKSDPHTGERPAAAARAAARPKPKEPRTLQNSEVRDDSWPCVLAFVRAWVPQTRFGFGKDQVHPEELVPPTLYLPDGRMVPVCVVAVQPGEAQAAPLPDWVWPHALYGGGMPILVETQAQQRRATAGCLVSDGHTTYALTSLHACGASGEPVYTLANGRRVEIGRASSQRLTKAPFTDIYPEFAGQRTFVNLDTGLIELSDLNDWTSQVYGLGATGALADLNELNITTRLIEAPVVAMGSVSGRLEGRIKALFYRYKSLGGYDYVSDFLIAPRLPGAATTDSVAQTEPGDSGAVWQLVTNQPKTRAEPGWTEADDYKGELHPLAMEWGGQVFLAGNAAERYAFTLATSLTTICKALDVELVLEHNTGVAPYWGKMGHYSIATFACSALKARKLKTLLTANVANISFPQADLTSEGTATHPVVAPNCPDFVPLADVPDLVWKHFKGNGKGGRDDQTTGPGQTTGPEHPTHYADIDQPHPVTHKTLRQLCRANSANLSVEVWRQFYTDCGHMAQHDRGLLPFRVWQFFNAMQQSAQAGDAEQFLCTAGLVAHYVGDACQPLHGSIYADGYPIPNGGDPSLPKAGAGVHSTYESRMIDRYASQVVAGIQAELGKKATVLPVIHSGKEAAHAIIALMDRSAKRIPPKNLVDAFIQTGGKGTVGVQDALWTQFGAATVSVMADGARVLARVWEGAWAAGKGNLIATQKLGPFDPCALLAHYVQPNFVTSLDLDHIGPELH